MTLKVLNGDLFINDKKFIVKFPKEELHSIDEDGKLVTIFRGHLFNHWDLEDIEGYFENSSLQLAKQLSQSGWEDRRKLLILAARFYRGLETVDTLQYANLSPSDINFIVYMR